MKFFKWRIVKPTPIVLDAFVKTIVDDVAVWNSLRDFVDRMTRPEFSSEQDMRNSIDRIRKALDSAELSFQGFDVKTLEADHADQGDG